MPGCCKIFWHYLSIVTDLKRFPCLLWLCWSFFLNLHLMTCLVNLNFQCYVVNKWNLLMTEEWETRVMVSCTCPLSFFSPSCSRSCLLKVASSFVNSKLFCLCSLHSKPQSGQEPDQWLLLGGERDKNRRRLCRRSHTPWHCGACAVLVGCLAGSLWSSALGLGHSLESVAAQCAAAQVLVLCWESLQSRFLSHQPGLAPGLTGKGAGSQSTPCYACFCAKLRSRTGLRKFKVLGVDSLISATTSEDSLGWV